MDYLKNHCWCSDSNWGGHYNCTIIVSLYSYKEGYKEDWDKLTYKADYFDEELYNTFKERHPEYEDCEDVGWKSINKLKPEVISWLEDNVPDDKAGKAWCVGSDKYIATDSGISSAVFFQRRKDAMKFIKTWSKWKKPIHYCQYFTDIRKSLDLQTGKYKVD